MPSDLFTAMREIGKRIAPEVPDLYLLRASDLPGLPVPHHARAYAVGDPSPAQRQAIVDAGLWDGPKPAIVFITPLTDRLEAYGLFAHELSHLLPYTPPSDAVVTPIELAASSVEFTRWASVDDVEKDMPRWTAGHGREWVRIACHIWYRMVDRCCLDVPPRFIRHEEYDQSPLSDYIAALQPELAATDVTLPFAEIIKTTAPVAFTKQFEQDKDTWLQLHEVKK